MDFKKENPASNTCTEIFLMSHSNFEWFSKSKLQCGKTGVKWCQRFKKCVNHAHCKCVKFHKHLLWAFLLILIWFGND